MEYKCYERGNTWYQLPKCGAAGVTSKARVQRNACKEGFIGEGPDQQGGRGTGLLRLQSKRNKGVGNKDKLLNCSGSFGPSVT